MSSSRNLIIVVVGVSILATLVSAFYFFYKKDGPGVAASSTASSTPVVVASAPETAVAREVPEGFREYRNTTYHFSLLYPEVLKVDEQQEGKNAITVTFQNTERGEGFQIFIVAHNEPQVSEARFKQDIPSGVRTDLANVTIDGATGAAFYSKDAALGDTREVWFVLNGYLYEVTTLKQLDTWLGSIMQTWQFT